MHVIIERYQSGNWKSALTGFRKWLKVNGGRYRFWRCSMKDNRVLIHSPHRREALILRVDEIRNKIAYFSVHERDAWHEQSFVVSFHLPFLFPQEHFKGKIPGHPKALSCEQHSLCCCFSSPKQGSAVPIHQGYKRFIHCLAWVSSILNI